LKKTTFKNTHNDGFYKSSWKDNTKFLQKLLLPIFQKKPLLTKIILKTTLLPLPLSHPPKPPVENVLNV